MEKVVAETWDKVLKRQPKAGEVGVPAIYRAPAWCWALSEFQLIIPTMLVSRYCPPVYWMRKLQFKQLVCLTQGHTASESEWGFELWIP